MGPGFLDDAFKTLGHLIIIVMVLVFITGYGCARGCDYVRTHYTVKVEKKP
jgi:hypothetical protein